MNILLNTQQERGPWLSKQDGPPRGETRYQQLVGDMPMEFGVDDPQPPPPPHVAGIRRRSRSPSMVRLCRRNMKSTDANCEPPVCKCPASGWHKWTDEAASSIMCCCLHSLGGGLPPASPAGHEQVRRPHSPASGRFPCDGAAWKRRRKLPPEKGPALQRWKDSARI